MSLGDCVALARELEGLGGSDHATVEDTTVVVRVAVPRDDGGEVCVTGEDGGCAVSVRDPTSPSLSLRRYRASTVIAHTSGGVDEWTGVGMPILRDLTAGVSVTLLSYGQSGTGKSGFVYDIVQRVVGALVEEGKGEVGLCVWECGREGMGDLAAAAVRVRPSALPLTVALTRARAPLRTLAHVR